MAANAGSRRPRRRERGAERTIGLVPGGPEQLGLAAHDGHQPRAHLLGRLDTGHGDGERVGDLLQLGDFLTTGGARGEMLAVGVQLVLVERPEHVGAGVDAPLALARSIGLMKHLRDRLRAHPRDRSRRGRPHESTCAGPSARRIFCRPRRMRPLIVPIGVSSMLAISL